MNQQNHSHEIALTTTKKISEEPHTLAALFCHCLTEMTNLLFTVLWAFLGRAEPVET